MLKAKNILEELIKIETSIPNGNESKACKYLNSIFKGKAVKIEEIGKEKRKNIIAYFGNIKSNKILVITGHLDVAPVNVNNWSTNPYVPYIDGNKLYGRGSGDMKGGIAIGIEAIFKSLENGYLKDKLVIFAGTADEETGANSNIGAKIVVEYLKKKGIKPLGVILPEPNNDFNILKVNIGHRGILWLECESSGKAMHPGNAQHKENNAIMNMFEFIETLNKEIPRDPIIENGIPGNSCRVTYVKSGEYRKYKTIPDKCVCNIDVRVSPTNTNKELLDIILSIANEKGITIKCIKQTDSSIIKKEEHIVKLLTNILEEKKQKYEICCAAPVCDAHWFNEAGMPTINTLGASGGNVHTNNEYAILDSFDKRVDILTELIRKF